MFPQGLVPPTTPELANRVAKDLDEQAAMDLVRRLKPKNIRELIDRSGLAGRLDKGMFDVLADAYDTDRSIRALPGR